jgi:hypothetical protein
MSNIQDAAKAAFKSNPELYPIINGIVREEDEDTVDVNLTLLAIDLFRNREDKWCTGLKMYVDEVKEAFKWYIIDIEDSVISYLIRLYTTDDTNNTELQEIFFDYVMENVKDINNYGYELRDIAYNFVVYDGGQYLITNQDESKLV